MSKSHSIESEKATVFRPKAATLVIIIGLILLFFSICMSIILGVADINFSTVLQGIFHYDSTSTAHQIVYRLRLPRALAAAFIGASLAVSGAIMQGMTRNALASPSIMGVTSGAMFTVSIAFAFMPFVSNMTIMLFAFIGAGLGSALVFLIGALSKRGLTPMKLALAGTAISALLGSISTGIALRFDVAKDISFWYAGGVAGVQWINVQLLIPIAILGLILAFFISKSITILSLGEDVAAGLGQKVGFVKLLGTVVVLLLTGAAVAVGGTIGFVGLVVPHIVRFIVGSDYRLIIPCSAVVGALLLVLSDVIARLVHPPFETPLGAITAIIGVPFFLYLARREGRGL
ncbi:iron ABC transporter permease [Cytobacillus oceanisediminis]|uniref:Iron ABC transporter permease n=1 Tax=Niallia alba TaxID=2729105 RepID=A0A7Y0KD22_9BACI|nr:MULTISPECIES: iron ABC transporter permease [Bacillaceae]MBQ6447194.1 iron ABC transporter permease [Bacillus sp. (in: firmicutes)]MBZ9535667.1 iron ABC transporter permease [Cytobacillus oceanisediminis]NMO79440.1 iron ABC transporter permease [Niallia alba]UTI42741.1 iron ABC transporter permease [Niallia sp. RD1]